MARTTQKLQDTSAELGAQAVRLANASGRADEALGEVALLQPEISQWREATREWDAKVEGRLVDVEVDLHNASVSLASLSAQLKGVDARAEAALVLATPLPGEVSQLQVRLELAEAGLHNATTGIQVLTLALASTDARVDGVLVMSRALDARVGDWIAGADQELRNVTGEVEALAGDVSALHGALQQLDVRLQDRIHLVDSELQSASDDLRRLGHELQSASHRADEAFTEGSGALSALEGVCFAKAKDQACPKDSTEQVLFHWKTDFTSDPYCGQGTEDRMDGNCMPGPDWALTVKLFGCCRNVPSARWSV